MRTRSSCSLKMAGILFFNADDGAPEAILRGLRSGFLQDSDYGHLAQCETLEDVKLNLQETQYGQFLRDFTELDKETITRQCFDRLAKEFQFIHANAAEPLRTFMDFCTYEFMIRNVMLIMKAVHKKHKAGGIDIDALLETCNPLGEMDSESLKSIQAFE